MEEKTVGLSEFLEQFNTEKKAITFFASARWPKSRFCVACGSVNTYEHKSRQFYYHCRDCRKQFSYKSNTIMQASPIPVRTWLYAMYQVSVAYKGINSLRLSKETGMTQKSARFMLQRIKKACKAQGLMLPNIAEIGETTSNEESNKHAPKKLRTSRSGVGKRVGKQVATAMRGRADNAKAQPVSGTNQVSPQHEIRGVVQPGAPYDTNEHGTYRELAKPCKYAATRHSAQKCGGGGNSWAVTEQKWDTANLGTIAAFCAKPTFESQIITGDVVKVLRRQSIELKFDVVIADPPYNIGKDFGNNRDSMPIGEYVAWSRDWLARCFRVLAVNGVVYVYGFPEVLAHIAVNYPINEQRWLAWHYTNKAVPSSKFWQRSHESILCLWKPGTPRPNLEINQIRIAYTDHFLRCAGKERKGTQGRYSNGKKTLYKDNGGALPRDVIEVPALAGGAGRAERWFACRDCGGNVMPPSQLKDHRDHDILKHPTQKPMALTKRLIRSRINGNGGRVLVPFAGSGSECVVAQSLGVPYLGIEINPEYTEFGRSWIKQCTA